jgi:hypothetical protein
MEIVDLYEALNQGSNVTYSSWPLLGCFQNATDGAGKSYVTCTGNIIIEVTCIVNVVLLSMMVYWNLMEKGFCTRRTWKRVKTWMLVMIWYFQLSLALRYNFEHLPREVHTTIVIVEQIAESSAFMTICYYVAKKGSLLD